jgi:hypothetical protein
MRLNSNAYFLTISLIFKLRLATNLRKSGVGYITSVTILGKKETKSNMEEEMISLVKEKQYEHCYCVAGARNLSQQIGQINWPHRRKIGPFTTGAILDSLS